MYRLFIIYRFILSTIPYVFFINNIIDRGVFVTLHRISNCIIIIDML